MLILSADTSLPVLSVALLRDRSVLGAVALEGKGSRNEKLLPAVDWLLAENGVDRRTIDLFAITRGPGSFTGVRIGLASLRGMALALGRPVCAMSTHEAIALGEGSSDGASLVPELDRIAVVDDAGRGEFYLSVFDRHEVVTPPRLVRADELESWTRDAALVVRAADFTQHANVAIGCARRAEEIAAKDLLGQYEDVTPIYVRLAEAEVKLQGRAP